MAFGEGSGFGSVITLCGTGARLASVRVAIPRFAERRFLGIAALARLCFCCLRGTAFFMADFFDRADLADGRAVFANLESLTRLETLSFLDFAETFTLLLAGRAFLVFLAADLWVTGERLLFSLAVRLLIISSVTFF
jgi:hypothetical protein